jgi:serine phosphatase RsbU (regulator of sigma subunit)/Tfp pilus assembly protein PilF
MKRKLCLLVLILLGTLSFAQRQKLDSLLNLKAQDNEDTIKVFHLLRICWEYKGLGKYDSSILAGEEGLILAKKLNYKTGQHKLYNNIGIAYTEQGIYNKALENHLASLRIKQEINDKKGMAQSYLNMGIIYIEQANYDKAIENFNHSLQLSLEVKSNEFTGNIYNALGVAYERKKDYSKARDNYEKGLRLKIETGEKQGEAYGYSNLGNIYFIQKEFDKALQNYLAALRIEDEIGDQFGAATALQNIGSIYREKGNFSESIRYFDKGLSLARDLGLKRSEADLSIEMSFTYAKFKDFENAYEAVKNYAFLKDTLFNEENSRQMAEMSAKYETAEKEKEIQLQKARIEKNEEESKKQRLFLLLFIAIAAAVAIIAIVIYRSLKLAKKQKAVIEQQKLMVDEKNRAIEEKQREIIDSITYAKRLQEAILPPLEFITKNLPENFVFYKPKDIVAGDFYWMEMNEEMLFIAAADCTGHGVPGAMVSVVCSNALNRAVKELRLNDPAKILDKVTDMVIETFEKSSSDVNDGMDISLLSINKKTKEIRWSGANNALWYVENGQLKKIRPDKQPVGRYSQRKSFVSHSINPSGGTVFYLFTDGYADQFGGENSKKFLYKRFEELLFSVSALPMDQQKLILDKSLSDWKRDSEQVDDITVIGIKV